MADSKKVVMSLVSVPFLSLRYHDLRSDTEVLYNTRLSHFLQLYSNTNTTTYNPALPHKRLRSAMGDFDHYFSNHERNGVFIYSSLPLRYTWYYFWAND